MRYSRFGEDDIIYSADSRIFFDADEMFLDLVAKISWF